MLSPGSFFNLESPEIADLFQDLAYVWDAVPLLSTYLRKVIRPNVAEIRQSEGDLVQRPYAIWQGRVYAQGISFSHGDPARNSFKILLEGEELPGAAAIYPGVALLSDDIELRPGAVVEPGAFIAGPTRIGEQSIVRQTAYIRGKCFVGRCCVVGHATEMKNSIMLDHAKAGHFAYLGDSILGIDTNLGAGTKLANLKFIDSPIRIRIAPRETVEIPFRKLGAILGDGAQTGCNSVTNPGTLLGKGSLVAPNTTAKAQYYPPRSVVR